MESHWQVKDSKEVYRTNWIRVREDQVLNHNNKPMTYSVVELNHPAVYVAPVTKDQKFYLIKQYIYTLDEWLWQLPAGGTDGQAPRIAAERELLEEAGLQAREFHPLGSLRSANGIAKVIEYVFLALDAKPVANHIPDELEEITEIRMFSVSELKAMIQDRGLIDAPTIAALTMACFELGIKEW